MSFPLQHCGWDTTLCVLASTPQFCFTPSPGFFHLALQPASWELVSAAQRTPILFLGTSICGNQYLHTTWDAWLQGFVLAYFILTALPEQVFNRFWSSVTCSGSYKPWVSVLYVNNLLCTNPTFFLQVFPLQKLLVSRCHLHLQWGGHSDHLAGWLVLLWV